MAKAGEIVMSDATAKAAGLDTSGLEQRTLDLCGREQSVEAWIQSAMSSVATTVA
jgi:class 3 adenylate cyclase